MKKKYLIATLFLVGILMASSLASASWFSDLFNKDKNLAGEADAAAVAALAASSPCIDSDNGTDIFVEGTTIGVNTDGVLTQVRDSCVKNRKGAYFIREGYCENLILKQKDINCAAKCTVGGAGVCPEPSCTDSDNGLNFYEAGTLTISGASYKDSCYDLATGEVDSCEGSNCVLLERQCGTVIGVQHKCPTGKCSEGACVKCTDSDDGATYNVKGITAGIDKNGKEVTMTDSCIVTKGVTKNFKEYSVSNELREYSCDGDAVTEEAVYTCPKGCINGACIDPKCNDTDGGMDYFVSGSAIGLDKYGKQVVVKDTCKTAAVLIEASCKEDADVLKTDYTCPYKCAARACVRCPEGSIKANNCVKEAGFFVCNSTAQTCVNGEWA
ncbi:MAG: hypothetical protein NT001_01425 [Candidatus Woesearchaeota archaeon]|nr:hypothetical protein [Candidatus Woesearchaeota archaeon]